MATFKKVRSITLPVFKWEANVERYYHVDGPMHLGKQIDDRKEPATLLPVTDLETGEQGQIIVGTVLRGTLEEYFPDASYVGKNLCIKQVKVPEKKYNLYEVSEVEVENDAPSSDAKKGKK